MSIQIGHGSFLRRIAIHTGADFVPGINAVVMGAALAAGKLGWELVGIRDGFDGLLHPERYPEGGLITLSPQLVENLDPAASGILGQSARVDPFHVRQVNEDEMVEEADMSDELLGRLQAEGIDAVISVVGGRGLSIVYKLHRKGLNAVCIPRSIENDIACTQVSFGFNTALSFTIEMLDKARQAAQSARKVPDGRAMRLKVRSLVGLLPLCASTVFEADAATRYPKLVELIALFRKRHPELVSHVAPTDEGFTGQRGRRLLSVLNKRKLERMLGYLLDENEFLGPHGIRSLSRHHLDHPFTFWVGPQEYKVQYLPAESNTGMFGGNSNWRGPVWMPVNALIIRGLLNLYAFFGDEFKVECPTGSGQHLTLFEVAKEISRRLASTFLRDSCGRRPVYGGMPKFQEDPHWRDLILFYEYFHGDNGAGLGASHQTGWTGIVAVLLDIFGRLEAKTLLETELTRVAARIVREQVGGEATGGR